MVNTVLTLVMAILTSNYLHFKHFILININLKIQIMCSFTDLGQINMHTLQYKVAQQ